MWRHVAPKLAERYTVVCADLRGQSSPTLTTECPTPWTRTSLISDRADDEVGYGQSSKPRGSDSHVEYSKKEMATDMVQLMSSLGFETFDILAHDRGARVAHRLALDHGDKVGKMVLLDIAPTLWMYEHTNMAFVSHPHQPLSFTHPITRMHSPFLLPCFLD